MFQLFGGLGEGSTDSSEGVSDDDFEILGELVFVNFIGSGDEKLFG